VSIAEGTDGLASKFGCYVQSKSKLKGTVTASGIYGSSIKSYSTVFQSVTYSGSSFTTSVPTSSGSLSLVTTVTDSRGRTASKTTTVTVVAYSNPGIPSFSVQRCDSSGTADDSGSYAKITYSYSVSSVNSKNSCSMKIEYKRSTATSWAGTLTSGTAYSASTSVVPTTALSADYQWDIRITVTDYFTSTTYTAILSSAEVIMDFLASGKGIAVGKTAERENTLDVKWDTNFDGNIDVCGDIVIGGDTANPLGKLLTASGDATSVATSTNAALASLSVPAGVWIIQASVTFATNATGYRFVCIDTTSAHVDMSRGLCQAVPGTSGTSTVVQATRFVSISAKTTYYCNAKQNSGSTLSCSGQLRAIRIA
jgi:hypothetical protein